MKCQCLACQREFGGLEDLQQAFEYLQEVFTMEEDSVVTVKRNKFLDEKNLDGFNKYNQKLNLKAHKHLPRDKYVLSSCVLNGRIMNGFLFKYNANLNW